MVISVKRDKDGASAGLESEFNFAEDSFDRGSCFHVFAGVISEPIFDDGAGPFLLCGPGLLFCFPCFIGEVSLYREDGVSNEQVAKSCHRKIVFDGSFAQE